MQPNYSNLMKMAGNAFCVGASTLQNSDTLSEACRIARAHQDVKSLERAVQEQDAPSV